MASDDKMIRVVANTIETLDENLDFILQDVANEKVALSDGQIISKGEALAKAIFNKALKEASTDGVKTPNWTKLLLERLHGKPMSRIESELRTTIVDDDVARRKLEDMASRLALEYDAPDENARRYTKNGFDLIDESDDSIHPG